MRILIIGAKGTLGQALAREFGREHDVVSWDREEVDLGKILNFQFSIFNLKPDVIINSAAYTNVDRAEEEKDFANQINGYAVGELAKICRDLDVPLVHFSTEYVFDGTKKEGYIESDQPSPLSTYGQSKYLGEQELQKNTNKFYLIRLSRLFSQSTPLPNPPPPASPAGGQGEEKGGGDHIRKKSFVQLMLDLAKMKSEIEVVDEELSSPTYAPDLSKLTRYIIENKLPYGIYHGANSGACTWFGFASEVFKIAGISVKLSPVPASRFPRPAKRPKYGILLNTKLPTQRPWQEALRESMIFPNN